MKDRALVVLVWLLLAGLIVGVVTAITAGVLLALRATDEAAIEGVPPVAEPQRGPNDAAADAAHEAASEAPTSTSTASATPSPALSANDGGAAPCAPLPPPGPFERGAPIEAEDLNAVDAVQIYPQAKALALELEPASVLRFISADEVWKGRVDLSAQRISYVFEYQRFGPTGRETGLVEIHAGCAGLHAKQRHNVAIYRHSQYDPVPDPTCSMERAWKAAVQSGLPSDVATRMIYRDDDIMKHGSPIVWSITVDGEPSHRREVHAHTCRLFRTFQSGEPVIVETFSLD